MKLYKVTKSIRNRYIRISKLHSRTYCKKLLLLWMIEDPENKYSIHPSDWEPHRSIDLLNDPEVLRSAFSESEVIDHAIKQLERKKTWDEKESERTES